MIIQPSIERTAVALLWVVMLRLPAPPLGDKGAVSISIAVSAMIADSVVGDVGKLQAGGKVEQRNFGEVREAANRRRKEIPFQLDWPA